MARNFFISFEKIDDRHHHQPQRGGTDMAGDGGGHAAHSHDDSNVIRLPEPRSSSPAARSTWDAFGRSTFIPVDAQPAFPPFNLKQATIDVVCGLFGLFFLSAVIAVIPLLFVILWLAITG